MRKFIALITYLVAITLTPQYAIAAAQSPNYGACYGVANADARAYCLAKAHNQSSYCYNIQAPGLRSVCFGEVRR